MADLTPRADVYAVLDGERDYQDELWDGLEDRFNGRTSINRELGEFICYIQNYTAKAAAHVTDGSDIPALEDIRKIGALCVACMERHGAVHRR